MMRNFELDKLVTVREVLAALEKVTTKAPTSDSFSHEIDLGDFGYREIHCEHEISYEGLTDDVMKELT